MVNQVLQFEGEVDRAFDLVFTDTGLRKQNTADSLGKREQVMRIWWNWQTRYFEVVVPKGVQVQVLLCAPLFLWNLKFH